MKQVQAARADIAGDGAAAFERFEQLARRLFAVPKKEVDEKLAAHRRHTRAKSAKR